MSAEQSMSLLKSFQAWMSIRREIGDLCTSLGRAESNEDWTAAVAAIEAIRERVNTMKITHYLWLKVNRELDVCVHMIECRGKKAPEEEDVKTRKIKRLLEAMKRLIREYEEE